MFNLTIDGKEYRVYFKHYPDEPGYVTEPDEFGDKIPTIRFSGKTSCFITEEDEQICFGESFCGVNEKAFDKSVGRKVSLARALEGTDKAFKTAIWEEYFKHTKRR